MADTSVANLAGRRVGGPLRFVYEIVNPSDAYTIAAASTEAACAAVMFLGHGAYALKDREDETVLPLFLFGMGDPAKWWRETFGSEMEKWWAGHRAEIADALDGVVIGSFGDRIDWQEHADTFTDAEKRSAWHWTRHDRKRSSMNDIGRAAESLAKHLRKGVEPEETQPCQE